MQEWMKRKPPVDLPASKLFRQPQDGLCIATEVTAYSLISTARLTPKGVTSANKHVSLAFSESDGFSFFASSEQANIVGLSFGRTFILYGHQDTKTGLLATANVEGQAEMVVETSLFTLYCRVTFSIFKMFQLNELNLASCKGNGFILELMISWTF